MKKLYLVFLMVLMLFSCGKNKETDEKELVQDNIFKNIDVEKLAIRIDMKAEEYDIKINGFKDLTMDNKAYFHSNLNGTEEESIMISYENLTPTGIFGKINMVNEENLEVVEKIAVVIIRASDTDITNDAAVNLYRQLLEKISDQKLTASVIYSNNLTYVIEIKEDGMVFYVK